MCLVLKRRQDFKRRINDRDEPIVVYKVFVESIDGLLQTPIVQADVPIDVVKGSNPFKAEGNESVRKIYDDGTLAIREGFVHCYLNINDAIRDFRGFTIYYGTLCIYRCELRKGVEYYRDSVYGGIAAKEIWIDRLECYIG